MDKKLVMLMRVLIEKEFKNVMNNGRKIDKKKKRELEIEDNRKIEEWGKEGLRIEILKIGNERRVSLIRDEKKRIGKKRRNEDVKEIRERKRMWIVKIDKEEDEIEKRNGNKNEKDIGNDGMKDEEIIRIKINSKNERLVINLRKWMMKKEKEEKERVKKFIEKIYRCDWERGMD